MSERLLLRILCSFLNRQGIKCDHGATHEVVIVGGRSLGKFCPPHADVVKRDGMDGFAASRISPTAEGTK